MVLSAGSGELARAASELAERLPPALAPLAWLAYNYRWSWLPGGPELFRSVDHERFERALQNPVRLLQEASTPALRRAAADRGLIERARTAVAEINTELERPADLSALERADGSRPLTTDRPIAFLCAEYGVHVSLPIYSGGLGVLAGDLLKEASDRAVPLVAVGLMYRKGYFRQRIDSSGWQHEYWLDTDPERLPAALVRGADRQPLKVQVPVYEHTVTAQIWRVDVGRVPLFLLDAELPENGPLERWITARLYDSDEHTRLAQYVLLGAGGIRALRALGIEPGVLHLNEGHAALAPLELAHAALAAGEPLEAALGGSRERTVFTTHTPVAAGNDSYPAKQAVQALGRLAHELGISDGALMELGRTEPANIAEPFGVTQAALRMSGRANAVSRRHESVAREMWHALWPDRDLAQVPIDHVTNGVHYPSWVGDPMRELLDRHVGADWPRRVADEQAWSAVDGIADDELWGARKAQRAALISFIGTRSVTDRLIRGDVREYAEAAARAFDPDVLTLGFARRVATYKRLDLLARNSELTLSLLSAERPVQVVLAGKAHPRDDEAKGVVQRLFGLKAAQVVGERVVYLDDYDIATAARLVQGCDLWINLPRPPLEASGTSGMKAAINGALQLSVLDGWWAEAFAPELGWALPGDTDPDHEAQDARDAEMLLQLLRDEVVPQFYERDERGIPGPWIARIRASLKVLGPRFSAARMLRQYLEGPYRGPR